VNNSWRPVARPALLILATAVVLGVLQGWLWSAIAPGVQYQATGDGRLYGLATSSSNAWVAIGLYVLLGIVVGIVLGVLAWKARAARGTLMFGAVTLSALAGAAIAYWVGNTLAGGVDPATVTQFSIITAPPAHYWLSIIVEPALAAATYTLRAAWNGSPTLDRPGVSGPQPDRPTAVSEPITEPVPVAPAVPPQPV
jgi:hypothetical protein